jgi:dolichol-phosphate mannosyltransferase
MKHTLKSPPVFGRFLIVGLLGTLVNLAVLWLLVEAGLPQLLASALATEAAIISNFIWNDRWTFGANLTHHRISLPVRFARFQGVTIVTALLTLGLFALFNRVAHLPYLLAQFVAIGITTIANYMINSRFTWQLAHPGQDLVKLPAAQPGNEEPVTNLTSEEVAA